MDSLIMMMSTSTVTDSNKYKTKEMFELLTHAELNDNYDDKYETDVQLFRRFAVMFGIVLKKFGTLLKKSIINVL